SYDPGGMIVGYHWTQIDEDEYGPDLIYLDNRDGQKLKIEGPQVDWDTSYALQLTVTDKDGNSDDDYMVLTVMDSNGQHTPIPPCDEDTNHTNSTDCPSPPQPQPPCEVTEGNMTGNSTDCPSPPQPQP